MTATLTAAIERFQNVTETENGAITPVTTTSPCLDLFSKISACRNNIELALELFRKAVAEDEATAFEILFHSRHCRGGQGERAVFRALLKEATTHHAPAVCAVIFHVAAFGRWDDLLCLEDTCVWQNVLIRIKIQLGSDLTALDDGEQVSLLAKWLPSANASSKDTKRLARKIYTYLGWDERKYRKTLVSLRNAIKIVEHEMCSREWSSIDYERVPSKAANMYRKAFRKQDGDRYQAYLDAVEKGEAKINAGTLFPYELVKPYLDAEASFSGFGEDNPITKPIEQDQTLEAQWKALPDYMEKPFNGLVVADVSGSMYCDNELPVAVSISLAIYIAERNKNRTFAGKFLTFHEEPKLESLVGNSLAERVQNLSHAQWGGSTNLVATFDLVLKAAIADNLPASEMPEKILIVSDMEFNSACYPNDSTNFQVINQMYKQAGYPVPQLVFWNVCARSNQAPFTTDEGGNAQLVSGCSPSIMKAVLNGDQLTAVQLMEEALTPYKVIRDAISKTEIPF